MSEASDRCAATRADGEPCQSYPVEASRFCIAHQDEVGESGAAPDEDGDERCGHPTRRGGLCRQYPMAGSDRCYHHADLDPTPAEQQASRVNPIDHGYFVKGFMDEEERELFEAVREGRVDPAEIKKDVLAALVVRLNRIMECEAQGQEVSGFTNEVFDEVRKVLESFTADELTVEHTFDPAEVTRQVERVLEDDPELLVRLLPSNIRPAVRDSLGIDELHSREESH